MIWIANLLVACVPDQSVPSALRHRRWRLRSGDVSRRILYVQATPAVLALILLWLA
jgi:hypothetical protein